VKPEDAPPERSIGPAPDDTAAHPADASLWELVFSPSNLAAALRRVEQNAGAPGIDQMSTKGAGTVVDRPLAAAPLSA